jgi:hypothetical protein
MTQYFGRLPWGDAVDSHKLMVPIPVGAICLRCKEAIGEKDSGILIPHSDGTKAEMRAQHRECFIRSIVGSVAHQDGVCSCNGGTGEDEEGVTVREAARAACRRAGIMLF